MVANFLPARARVLDLARREGEELFTLLIRKDKPEIFKIEEKKEVYEKVYGSTYFMENVAVCYAAATQLENKIIVLDMEEDAAQEFAYGFVENKARASKKEALWAFVDAAYKLLPAASSETVQEINEEYGRKILWGSSVPLFFDRRIALPNGIEEGQRFIIREKALWKPSF